MHGVVLRFRRARTRAAALTSIRDETCAYQATPHSPAIIMESLNGSWANRMVRMQISHCVPRWNYDVELDSGVN